MKDLSNDQSHDEWTLFIKELHLAPDISQWINQNGIFHDPPHKTDALPLSTSCSLISLYPIVSRYSDDKYVMMSVKWNQFYKQ